MSLNELINPMGKVLDIVVNQALETYAVPTIITSTATLTAAQLVNGVMITNGGGAITLTTPTATLLLAGMPTGAQRVGATIEVLVSNIAAQAVTYAAGTGVTITNLSANPQLANTSRRFLFICTNIGTPAFNMIG